MDEIKIIFFDIDWTLYDHINKCFPKSTLRALKKLKEKGIKVFLSTARPYNSMKLLGIFDLCIQFDGYIGSNGAITVVGDKVIDLEEIQKEDVLNIIKAVKYYHQCGEYITKDNRYLITPINEVAMNFYRIFSEEIPSLKEYEGEVVTGFNLFNDKKYDNRIKKYAPNLVYKRYFDYGIDVSTRIRSKGNGVDKVLQYYNYHKENAIAFGDDLIDLSMKSSVKYLIAMGNGKEEVKNNSDFVTKSIEEDGIEFALQKLHII